MSFRVPGDIEVHSHDRTMLARLGFADPDRKDAKHDLACHYLAEPDRATKLLGHVFSGRAVRKTKETTLSLNDRPHEYKYGYGYKRIREEVTVFEEVSGIKFLGSRHEHHLSKGEGKYATTVGFIDLVLEGESFHSKRWTERVVREWPRDSTPEAVDVVEKSKERLIAVVEVKVAPVSASDILRQLQLYRQHFDLPVHDAVAYKRYVVATTFALSAMDRAMLEREQVKAVQLGNEFERWADSVRMVDDSAPPPVVL